MQAPKLLLVEDDPAVRASLQRRLRFEGFDVEAAEQGEHALEMFSSVNPNLVLLDVMLPGVDGFTV
ncbi:MAG: response regulator, partial [Candidatus Eremiobacteraeota bacterium]|nr:response regulator [Candidatus Eremiobacteraeota bacterium]